MRIDSVLSSMLWKEQEWYRYVQQRKVCLQSCCHTAPAPLLPFACQCQMRTSGGRGTAGSFLESFTHWSEPQSTSNYYRHVLDHRILWSHTLLKAAWTPLLQFSQLLWILKWISLICTMLEDAVVWKYFIFLVAVDDNAFLDYLQTIELYNISLQLSKNPAWMFMAMSCGSIGKSLLLFLIESCTQTGNISMIPVQQLVQK